jgi:hypothetical protein
MFAHISTKFKWLSVAESLAGYLSVINRISLVVQRTLVSFVQHSFEVQEFMDFLNEDIGFQAT